MLHRRMPVLTWRPRVRKRQWEWERGRSRAGDMGWALVVPDHVIHPCRPCCRENHTLSIKCEVSIGGYTISQGFIFHLPLFKVKYNALTRYPQKFASEVAHVPESQCPMAKHSETLANKPDDVVPSTLSVTRQICKKFIAFGTASLYYATTLLLYWKPIAPIN